MRSVPRGTFDRIVDRENLWQAYRRTRRCKRSGPEVALYEVELEHQLTSLRDAMVTGQYRPRPYRVQIIRDPKIRPIVIAAFSDRVLHQALHYVVAPYYYRSFIDHTYACLPGRGTHRAVIQFLKAKRRSRYHLSLDIKRFFPSIDHEQLLQGLLPYIREQSIARLIETIVRSAEGLYQRPEICRAIPDFAVNPNPYRAGVPIGTLTSQWWANGYLNGIDHFIKRTLKVKWYQRYMDNLDLFHDDQDALENAKAEIRDWLWIERKLRLNPKNMEIRPAKWPCVYLGYRVSRAGISIGPIARRRMKARLRRLRGSNSSTLSATLRAYKALAEFG